MRAHAECAIFQSQHTPRTYTQPGLLPVARPISPIHSLTHPYIRSLTHSLVQVAMELELGQQRQHTAELQSRLAAVEAQQVDVSGPSTL